ncbi:MAG: hypothetical protein IPM66_14695 [Acidobacteriota bacterium]|nr:MAG: hypothetical protein IPM66_14695 [Acidobacteriota bacterium]
MDPGFLELKTPQQLFAKLEIDFKKAVAAPLDSHSWFNFFVTAEHLPDWIFTKNPSPNEFRKSDPILKVCSHIANGGKHFIVDRHNAVVGTAVHYIVFQLADDSKTNENVKRYDNRQFVLHLSDDEAKALGKIISVEHLAARILKLYRELLADSTIANNDKNLSS